MTDISAALTTYVTVLSSTKTEAECVRNDATSGGLKVNGTVVQEPKDASDAKKTALYSNLSGRMDAANSNLATAQQNLRTSLAPQRYRSGEKLQRGVRCREWAFCELF